MSHESLSVRQAIQLWVHHTTFRRRHFQLLQTIFETVRLRTSLWHPHYQYSKHIPRPPPLTLLLLLLLNLHYYFPIGPGSAGPIPLVFLLHLLQERITGNKYDGPPYCWAEMCAGRVTCCPLVSHDEVCRWDIQTDKQTNGWTDARPYITLSARGGQHNERSRFFAKWTIQWKLKTSILQRLKITH